MNTIDVVGKIWMPAVTGATTYNVTAFDIENMREPRGDVTRDSVALWLDAHAGDFQSVDDFRALLSVNGLPVELDWSEPENEYQFADMMYPEDEES